MIKNTRKMIFIFSVLSLTALAFFPGVNLVFAGEEAYTTAFDLANIDQPPRVLRAAMPRYPFTAKKEGIEGLVLLRFVVDEKGSAREPEVVKSEPEGVFDRAALDSIVKYIFKPAVKDGKDVACIVRLPVRFAVKAEDKLAWSNAYRADEVDHAPLVLDVAPPVYPPSAKADGVEGFVALQFVVGANGYAYDPVIINSVPGNVFDDAALDALYDYRFEPAVKDGADVDCIMTLTIKF